MRARHVPVGAGAGAGDRSRSRSRSRSRGRRTRVLIGPLLRPGSAAAGPEMMSGRSIQAVHQAVGLVATKPGVNIINGGRGDKPWEAKCSRTSLGTFATEQEAYLAYVEECHQRGMVPRTERSMRPGNPALAGDATSASKPKNGQGGRATAWTAEEIGKMNEAVGKQLQVGGDAAPTSRSFDWEGIAETLQTHRTGPAVRQKWVLLNRSEDVFERVDTTVPPTATRSKRERKHRVLPDDEINIDLIDHGYFEAALQASRDSHTADMRGTTRPRKQQRTATAAAAAAAAEPPIALQEAREEGLSMKGAPWTDDEISRLVQMVGADGTGKWAAKATALGTGRTRRAVCQMYYSVNGLGQTRTAQLSRDANADAVVPVAAPAVSTKADDTPALAEKHDVGRTASAPTASGSTSAASSPRQQAAAIKSSQSDSSLNPSGDASTATSFSGIEYARATSSWRLISGALPPSKDHSSSSQAAQMRNIRFETEAVAARAYDTIVGQHVNYTLGDVVRSVSFDMVGQGVQAQWNAEETYSGEIVAVDLRTNKARVKYDDGQIAWESIHVVDEDSSGTDGSSKRGEDDAVVMRLLLANTAVTASVGGDLDKVSLEAAAVSVDDADVIRQYLSFWFTNAKVSTPPSPNAAAVNASAL